MGHAARELDGVWAVGLVTCAVNYARDARTDSFLKSVGALLTLMA